LLWDSLSDILKRCSTDTRLAKKVELMTGMKLEISSDQKTMVFDRALTKKEYTAYGITQPTAFFTRWFPWKMDINYWKERQAGKQPYLWYVVPSLSQSPTVSA
jgi:hypothetical protein